MTTTALCGIEIKTTGVHHVALRSTDLARSKVFYVERLGFPLALETPELIIFIAGQTAIAVRGPAESTSPNDSFDPFRVGLDHVALGCTDEGELRRVAEALAAAGVENTGVKLDPTLSKRYVAFKDPDGVKWELFMTDDPVGTRRALLRSVADAYFMGLTGRDFGAIPYAENVTLRAPLVPGGVTSPLVGRETIRTVWWAPLVPALESVDVRVIDHYVNEPMTAICVAAEIHLRSPRVTLRVADRFTVSDAGEIIEQENHFDPRDVTNPGWRES